MEFTPDKITSLQPNEVFVFGSNLAGMHGGGAARVARKFFGAVMGQGVGLQGQSYAIPTMQGGVETIRPYVDEFIAFAAAHPELKFYVTRIGCGIAGFTAEEIAPLFKNALGKPNIVLPQDFAEVIGKTVATAYFPAVSWYSHRDFLNEYHQLKAQQRINPAAYGQIKALRAKEFRNTVELATRGWYITESGKKVMIEGDAEMRRNTAFYADRISLDISPESSLPTDIQVVNDDCLAVAQEMAKAGMRPAVLNMASRRNPGGGVVGGAGAQEETLFRRTNLFRSLYQFAPYSTQYGLEKARQQYPLDPNFGGVYTPGATLFRLGEREGYRLMDRPIRLDFISMAGMNRPELVNGGTEITPHLVPGIKNKIRTILAIAVRHRHTSLVLGALGCGAFRNPPRHVARLFKEVLSEPEFKNRFSRIVFAILEDHNSHHSHNPEGNFLPFKEVFSG